MSSSDERGLGEAHVRVTGSGFTEDCDQSFERIYRRIHSSGEGLTASFLFDVASVFDEAEELLIGRHKDYGPGNIANAYPDPLTALVVRMGDKMERIKHILASEGEAVYGERLRDSWLDLANYSLIGTLVLDGKWPGVKR